MQTLTVFDGGSVQLTEERKPFSKWFKRMVKYAEDTFVTSEKKDEWANAQIALYIRLMEKEIRS